MNHTVLMSGADHFAIQDLNSYNDLTSPVDLDQAKADHAAIRQAMEAAGITVTKVDPPTDCPDGIFTANWGLCRAGDRVVLSKLPPQRAAEEPYAEKILQGLGKQTIKAPYTFSGQGDALPCGDYLFCGQTYRTDYRMHGFLADQLGYEVISLETVPQLDDDGQPVTNSLTGWPYSFFYDIDLALSVIRPDLIAWCPDAFMPDSQEKVRSLDLKKIEISLDEALNFACNLVSTGETVIMSDRAPQLKAKLEKHGLKVVTPTVKELLKGGGFIRCTTLTLDNE